MKAEIEFAKAPDAQAVTEFFETNIDTTKIASEEFLCPLGRKRVISDQ